MDSRNNVAAFSRPRRSSSSRVSQDSSRAFSNRRKGNNEIGSSSSRRNFGSSSNGRKNRCSRVSSQSQCGSRTRNKNEKKLNSSRKKAANNSTASLKASPLVARKAVTENVNRGKQHRCFGYKSVDRHQQGRFPMTPAYSTPPFQSDGNENYVTVILPYHIAKAAKEIEREEEIEFEQYQRQYFENPGSRLGPPIPLKFDDLDEGETVVEMDSADEQDTSGQYSDTPDWRTRADQENLQNLPPISDGRFTFPLSKFARKGIGARWQEQHPQWRDGRYCIDRMISSSAASSLPTATAAAEAVLSLSSPRPLSRRHDSPPDFEVYVDEEYR